MRRCAAEISGPSVVAGSCGSPGRSSRALAASASTKRSKIPRCTYTRSVHRQTCPVFRKLERATPSTALSKSQSSNTSAAFLPPSSKDTGRTPSAAWRMIVAPVRDSPVKVMPLTRGWVTIASPVEPGPKPWTRLNTPAGTRASSITSASRVAVAGVSSDGLATTALPQASAGASFQVSSSSGRFHGAITPTTPSGRRIE